MSFRVSLRGMLRLIRVDTLRRVHNVGFLAGTAHIFIYKRSFYSILYRNCVAAEWKNSSCVSREKKMLLLHSNLQMRPLKILWKSSPFANMF